MINQEVTYNLVTPGPHLFFSHIEGVLNSTVANAYWKDTTGTYIGANERQLKRFRLASYSDLIGATDYDLAWRADADQLHQNDLRVIKNHQTISIKETVSVFKQDYLSFKAPLLNREGGMNGVVGLSYLLSEELDLSRIIDEITMIIGSHGAKSAREFLIQHQRAKLNLSKRQLACLDGITNGMTVKQIATSLSLSPRTVEHYIEAIKLKLNCSSRMELIMKMKEIGIL